MPPFPPPFQPPFAASPNQTMPYPPPPPGFFPRQPLLQGQGHRTQSTAAMQDPLSSIPHQTYQAHHQSGSGTHTGLPSHPPVQTGVTTKSNTSAVSAAEEKATISAQPELRDFKKESTAFVPASLKRKRVGGATTVSGNQKSHNAINAAPLLGPEAGASNKDASSNLDDALNESKKPDLLSTLREKFGPAPVLVSPAATEKSGEGSMKKAQKPKDDYEKFMDEMGDMLGPQVNNQGRKK